MQNHNKGKIQKLKWKKNSKKRLGKGQMHILSTTVLCTSQHNDINRLLQFIYVGMCPKFIINKDSFFLYKVLYRIFPKLIHYYNIRFLYRIRKVIKNISINILSHDGKNSWDEDGFIEIIQSG